MIGNDMQFKKMTLLFEYAGWIFKKYNELQNQPCDIYRIIEVKQSAGKYKVVIQLIGKSIFFEYTPQEIVTNDRMLEGFSKQDIRNITYLACESIKKPKYKIVMQQFCFHFNKMLFQLKKCNSNEVIMKTANQISLDKNLINSLSHEDVQSISYIAGYEHSLGEKNDMDTAKNNVTDIPK
jgi:hypothetical protein